ADGGHVGPGDARVHPAHRAHRARARAHPALHRARHGGGVRHRPSHHRAPSGPGHRRRRPRRGPPAPRRPPRLSRRASMSGGPLLAVEDVYTFYGLSQVLFGVSLEVAAGECVCLLGRNGVGKTTTMRSIMGLTPPRQGRVTWKGRDVAGRPPYQIADLGIGFVPEDRRIFADLTVWENLDVATRRRDGTSPWTLERVFDLFPKLRELVDRQG